MSRLPTPGADNGNWGTILNDFLTTEHNSDGSLKNVARPSDITIKANDTAVVHKTSNETITGVKTFASSPIVPEPSTANQATPKSYVDTQISSLTGTPDADSTTKGKLQLTGDLGGTASSPTVPGLASKAASGVNNDITSITGLTTPISTAQGGTGRTDGRASVEISSSGTSIGVRPTVNIIPGANLTLVAEDDAIGNKVDVTIDALESTYGTWIDVTRSPYSADKTGASDARAAIQQAIDDAAAAGGGVVYCPAGNYMINYSSDAGYVGLGGGLQLKSSVILQGEGFATKLFGAGSWLTEAGIVGIGNFTTTRAVRQAQVRDILIKGSSGSDVHETPISNISGILFNSAGITGEPDAVHRITNIWIWDTDRALVFMGNDDQAIVATTIRTRWSLRQGVLLGREDGSGGGPDNYLSMVDVSSANRGGGTYAGFEIYAGNVHMVSCKAWYCKRSTAFQPGHAYKDGAGFYLGATRIFGSNIEAQDNGGHGIILRYGSISIANAVCDSNSYYDSISGAALVNECYGVLIGAGVSSATIAGLNSFNRSPSHRDQRYGISIDSGSRNLNISGTTSENYASPGSPTVSDGVVWTASPHATHIVAIGISAGGNSTRIINGYEPEYTGIHEANKLTTAQEVTVTGTTLTEDAQLFVDIPGGALRYAIEATIFYRADATAKAKLTLLPSITSGTGIVEGYLQYSYNDIAASSKIDTKYLNVSGSNFVAIDGAGNNAATISVRSVRISGSVYVGTTVVTGKFAIAVAENSGTATGVKLLIGSHLKATLLK